ncbi:MAG: phosphatase PAP2 family protein [Bacillati bacterium ANGP1]|uniref:Phosphatase PAP2 family protein n=1 Tax=Candidatus Segetimicrobium genomatis TaxID=2569760 RepID=A0A537IUF1_9BACT|nr:MAG: phosphatase PAP2 family protein [Terrabacteria group bacterium ANGP1]
MPAEEATVSAGVVLRRRGTWGWVMLVCFVLLAGRARGGLLPGDQRTAALLYSLPAPLLRACAIVASTAGIAALGLVAAWRYRQDLRLLPLAATMGLLLPIDAVTKFLVHRLRPQGAGFGFPSGHAMVSMTAALLVGGAVWPALDGRRKAWATVLVAAFVSAVAVGLVGRGWHWPSDILGGWLLAAAYSGWTLPLIQTGGPGRAAASLLRASCE